MDGPEPTGGYSYAHMLQIMEAAAHSHVSPASGVVGDKTSNPSPEAVLIWWWEPDFVLRRPEARYGLQKLSLMKVRCMCDAIRVACGCDQSV